MKKHLFKKIIIFTLMLSTCSSLFFPCTATATERRSDSQILAAYDIEKGGLQIFHVQDQSGNNVVITIEKIKSNSRIADDSYKVTYDHTLFWKAGFHIKISDNKITSAYSPFHTVVWGSISGNKLTLNSTSKATYKFIHKAGLLNTTTGVIASISGTTLNVSRL